MITGGDSNQVESNFHIIIYPKGIAMKLNLDKEKLDIPCPSPTCRKKIKETIGRLKKNPKLACSCGQVFILKADELRRFFEHFEKSLSKNGGKTVKLIIK
ncbi:MAG: hypothetical protein FWH15_07765 [Betaproteobacteria bacterium]|nr:hypothetical protein [Betaproteobacteria bacterium]